MQNDIDGKNEKGKKYKPGQYFVLKFDFSPISASPDLAEANQNLIVSLNSSIEDFYETYATYLGEDVTSLCGNIDSKRPSISLQKCNRLVQRALSRARNKRTSNLPVFKGSTCSLTSMTLSLITTSNHPILSNHTRLLWMAPQSEKLLDLSGLW